ncbi:hypothetical protein OVA14_05490 [Agrococcus sp. SL85]|uniref:hypothetical protein n=1 Tax=Agrococcus sp. SL85 TaxID=2995141 RepID=UPI00226D0F4F|nr:hypothetical protein [Agrococcus sp. SL85]WAC67196.1 hypothetical protein OVA14_05490 [Agrococcus sp. SL85]
MSDERPPGMSEEFQARMRLGLSTMAVRERVRERRRNRAIAGGAVAAAVVAVVAVLGGQVLAGGASERDVAVPTQTAEPTTEPTQPSLDTPTPEPTETEPAEPTPPPGFEGVAAGEPSVLDSVDCSEGGCGDAGAAGGPSVEGVYDVYVLCQGTGQVRFGDSVWIDCTQFDPGTGWALLAYDDTVGDGDPEFTATSEFDGRLDVLPTGESPQGRAQASTATVYYDCSGFEEGPIIDGVQWDCRQGGFSIIPDLGAWGVPIPEGSYAPRIRHDGDGSLGTSMVRWVEER